MKNEYQLHFLGWIILSHLQENEWLGITTALVAIGYAVAGLVQLWSGRK